jgi:hypothetical protein
MSERSVSLQLCGAHASRVQRPKKNVFGWVVRQLQRKQQQQQCQADMAAPSMVSGSSYDSLYSLDEQCSTSCSTEPAACEWQPPSAEQFPGLTHQQQQQQLYPLLEQAAEPQAADASSSRSGAPLGFLQRAVRAVLRPVVRAVVGAAHALASSAGPQGPGNNDNSMTERVINVLTSLPFIAVGLHGLRWVAAGGSGLQLRLC